MRDNQRGFTLVEGLIVGFIVVALAAVGWYVYTRQVKDLVAQTQTNTTPQTEETEEPAPEPEIDDGWETYEAPEFGISFKYPPFWIISGVADAETDGFDVYIKSPSVRYETHPTASYRRYLVEGAIFHLSVNENPSGYKNASEYLESIRESPEYHQDIGLITIGDEQVYAANCGHWDPLYCTAFVRDHAIFLLEYQYPYAEEQENRGANKSQEMATFMKLLESVKIVEP